MDLVPQIFDSDHKAVIAVTGGGSGALSRLLTTPGASSLVLEAVVPYAQTALAEWLGRAPEQACCDKTARQMAMASWLRARALADDESEESLIGVGCTASLATTRPKRGEHRLHVAAQTSQRTLCLSLLLEKGARSRQEEEAVAEHAVLAVLGDASGVKRIDLSKTPDGIEASLAEQQAPTEWTELLLDKRQSVGANLPDAELSACVFVSGSFDPLHHGHEEIARIASEISGRPAVFEVALTNADKPPLDFIELQQRLESLGNRPTLLTTAPTFVEKARLAPGGWFAVGADTVERIAEPKFYPKGEEGLFAAIEELGGLGCRFLVFGREIGGVFKTLSEIDLPEPLARLCDGVPENQFREDISSTELREDES